MGWYEDAKKKLSDTYKRIDSRLGGYLPGGVKPSEKPKGKPSPSQPSGKPPSKPESPRDRRKRELEEQRRARQERDKLFLQTL